MRKLICLSAAVLILNLALALLAEDVQVKVINPDGASPTTQPDNTSAAPASTTPKPTTPTPGPRPAWTPVGGDWMISNAFSTAKVTDDQKAKLKDVLAEMEAAAKADQDKTTELWKKARDLGKAAKDAGKDPAKDPDVRAAAEEIGKQWQENAKAMAARREKLLASLDGVLSADQIEKIKDQFDLFSPDLATRNKPLAKGWIRSSLPGVTISDEQEAQIIAKVAPIQEKYGAQLADLRKTQNQRLQDLYKENPKEWQANYKKVNEEFGPKMDSLKLELAKALNETIESMLTPEQKAQMVSGRQEAWKKSVQGWVEGSVKSFDAAKPTDEQKARIKDLAEAAGQAMLNTEMYDNAGRAELANKFREDAKKLLTEEQLKKVR
ncbi:MAG: hypothetical protein BIFFINMI_02090 [Phycisphaerae bacterium]|nr:hypothetical protein [Phycisphaerae bacterium]